MKQVVFSKQFKKKFARQPQIIRLQFDARLRIWNSNSNDPILNTHRLKGKLKQYHSINITGDVRALYEVINGTVYIFDLIGTHSQLY